MKRLIIIIISIITIQVSFAQDAYHQTIRGNITDKISKLPLIGATVVIVDSDPVKGTISDVNGDFRLEQVPVGRLSLKISYVGYNPVTLNNLDLRSGKEMILNISMEEQVVTTEEVVIRATIEKDKPLNELATVSARSFTVEETNRYAGSLGDPARMAANYAGVLTANDSRNDIIIRGNSPMGVLWRLDGVEIPNPNHFGALGTTGGPVSMLNNNLLDNSDFYTGAFPAEFGNALSGVFDLNMRTGNNEKREYTGQIGFNGFELALEGPFNRQSKSSYLASYRYSTLSVMNAMGIDFGAGSSTPQYQDLSFKIDIPGTKYGRFSLFGIGGISFIELDDREKESTEFSYGVNGTDTHFGSDMGAMGLSHLYFFKSLLRMETQLSVSGTRVYTNIDSLNPDNSAFPFLRSNQAEAKYSLSTSLAKKMSARNFIRWGLIFDIYHVNYLDSIWESDDQEFRTINNEKGDLQLIQSSVQWQHKFSDQLTLNSGVHYQQLFMTNSITVEPRMGLKWDFSGRHSLSIGAGMHSQMQPRVTYFILTELPGGENIKTNEDVDFTKAVHFVIGYDYLLKENLRFKSETYYQYIYNVPVVESMNPEDGAPQFSMLNAGDFFAIPYWDSLVNEGTGTNMGVELTLEKFFSKGYYMLLTASLFDSKYKAYDGIERNTSFNGNYVINALAGWEFKRGKHMKIFADVKGVYAGGKRYIPVNESQSLIDKETVYYYEQSYNKKYDEYFNIDCRFGIRLNSKNINQEWALDLKNMTNHQNIFMQSYDPATGKLHTDYQQGFFPMMLYRIQF